MALIWLSRRSSASQITPLPPIWRGTCPSLPHTSASPPPSSLLRSSVAPPPHASPSGLLGPSYAPYGARPRTGRCGYPPPALHRLPSQEAHRYRLYPLSIPSRSGAPGRGGVGPALG